MSTLTANLQAAAFADARAQLATAKRVDLNDALAVIRSQAALAAILGRVLRTLDAEDDAADVAAQVAAEDGVRSIGVPYQRGSVAA